MKHRKIGTPKIMYALQSYCKRHYDTRYENTRNEHKHRSQAEKKIREYILSFLNVFQIGKRHRD